MTNRVEHGLNRARKLLLVSAGIAALAGPVAIGVIYAPQMRAQSRVISAPSTVDDHGLGTDSSASADAAAQAASPQAPVPTAPVQASTPQQGSVGRSTEKAL